MLQQPQYVQQGPTMNDAIMVQRAPVESLLEATFNPNDRLLVAQRFDPMEIIVGFETQNIYDIFFGNGYKAVAVEESDFLSKWCLGNKRPFKMHIFFRDNKQEFLTLERPFKFYFEEVSVRETASGQLIGKIKRNYTVIGRKMSIIDESGKTLYHVVSPFCRYWTFFIDTPEGQRVGEIRKKWSGFVQQFVTDTDNFGIQFPNASAKDKALIFSATFLIDFLYFNTNGKGRNF